MASAERLRIDALELFPLSIPLRRPHRVSLGLSKARAILIIRLISSSGLIGIGEAVAHPSFSGETLQGLSAAVQYLKKVLIGGNPLHIVKLKAEMDRYLHGNYGAKAGIEIALFDIMGKYYEAPLYQLLGGKVQDRLMLSHCLSQSDLERDIAEAQHFVDKGYKIIKVKVGVLDVEQDVERVRAVRETLGPEVSLRADANQAWDIRSALKFINGVVSCNLEFIEQPLPRWDLEGLAYLRRKSDIPIMVDEAAVSRNDVIEIIRKNSCDLISVKLMKNGGIINAREIVGIAGAAGIKCYLGSQIETSIGVSAGLHFALSSPDFSLGAELEGPTFFLQEDVVKEGVQDENGFMSPLSRAGLGVELDMDTVHKYMSDIA